MQRDIAFDPEQSLYLPAARDDCDAERERLLRIRDEHARVSQICDALTATQDAFTACMRPTMRPPQRFLLDAGHRTTLAQVPEICDILPDVLHRDRPINFQAKIDHVAGVYCRQALERDRLRRAHEEARIRLLEQLERLRIMLHAASRTSMNDLPADVLDLILDRAPAVAREVCRTFRRLKPMNNLSLFRVSGRIMPGPQPRSHRICRIRIQGVTDFDFTIFGDRPLYLSFDTAASVPVSAHVAGLFASNAVDFSRWNLPKMQAFTTISSECLSNMLGDIRPTLRYLYIPSLHGRVMSNWNHILVTDRSVIVDATTFDNCLLYGVEFDQPPIVLGASAATQDRYPGAILSDTRSARSRPIPARDIPDCSEYRSRVAYY